MNLDDNDPGPWFRALAETLPDGVLVLARSGEPVFASEVAARLLGMDRFGDEALRAVRELLPENPEASCADFELVARTEVGLRPVRIRSLPMRSAEPGVLLIVEDRALQTARSTSLLLANRMNTANALRSRIHDLKAPLNALALNVELLSRYLATEEDKSEEALERQLSVARVLEKEIARLGRSLDGFLREQRGPGRAGGRRVEVRRIAREVARLLRAQARESNVEIRLSVPKEPVHAAIDGDRLKEVLLNMVLNALEAQPGGGEIRTRVLALASEVRIVVEDDGPGIPPPLRERVFEMHFTTKERGTGIGLAVARSLIEGQGGHIALLDDRTAGTALEIRLPRTPSPRRTGSPRS